jgi:hypothetical protein
LLFVLGVFIIFFIVIYKRAQLKFEIEKQQFQQTLLQAEIEIREQTFLDISRELHDNLGQLAALIKINLNQLGSPFKEQSKLQDSIQLVSQMISSIKSISTSLNSDQLSNIGLEAAIKLDVQRINKLGLIKLDLVIQSSNHLSSGVSIFLYRIYQEIINNVLSHSKATKANILLQQTNGLILFSVTDNGIGFSGKENKHGNGLRNIKARCEILGAELIISSQSDKGAEIIIKTPLDKVI